VGIFKWNRKGINLLPGEQQESQAKRTAVHYTRLVIFALILVCVANLVLHGLGYGYLAYTNAMTKREIEELHQIRDLDYEIRMREEFFERRAEQIIKLRENEMNILAYLEVLENVLPTDFASRGIEIGADGAIRISGSAPNLVVTGDVLNVLSGNELVSSARIENLEHSMGRVNFDIVGVIGGD
jgi:hypothetical protein